MQLFCVIVNYTGGAFTVEIGEDQPVWNLKDAIKKRKQNKLKDVDAADLRLFLAKKHSKNEAKGEGGDEEKWLTQLGAYDVIDTRDYIFLPFPGAKLKAVGLASDQLGKVSDEDAAVGRGHVHVLVEIVEEPVPRRTRAHSESDDQRLVKRQKATEAERWEWKEEEPVYYRKGRLFFVNREKAIEQLAALHEINFKRAIRGRGGLWVTPLLDNAFGIGKSTFGQEYIRECQSLQRGSTMMPEFIDTLRSCHTIRIVLQHVELLDENGGFQAHQASRNLVNAIRNFFLVEYGIVPQALVNLEGEGYVGFLVKLTQEVGPLFIVIDEIGLAFDNDKLDDFARREQFMKFCRLLQPLFENRKLFFLIAVVWVTTFNPFKFKRLDTIKTIIENTRWERTSTIEDHLQLLISSIRR